MFCRMMFAAGGIVNPLPGGNFDSGASPSCSSSARFNVNGTVDHVDNGSPVFRHNWHTGGGDTTLYIRFTLQSGDTPNIGTTGTWQQLNTARSIGYSRNTAGVSSGTIRVQIATDAAGSNIISTSAPTDYSISAEVFV